MASGVLGEASGEFAPDKGLWATKNLKVSIGTSNAPEKSLEKLLNRSLSSLLQNFWKKKLSSKTFKKNSRKTSSPKRAWFKSFEYSNSMIARKPFRMTRTVRFI